MLSQWRLEDGKQIGGFFAGHTQSVRSCALFGHDSRLVSASADKTLRVWDMYSHDALAVLKAHMAVVYSCCVTPDNRFIISGSADRAVCMWNANTFKLERSLVVHSDVVQGVAVAADSASFASASKDHSVIVWKMEEGQVANTLLGHTEGVLGVAFSPDGKRLASCSVDRSIILWNASDGSLLRKVSLKTVVPDCCFSPDGNFVLAACRDNTARLLAVDSSKEVLICKHSDYVECVRFAADGSKFLTGSLDMTVKVWTHDLLRNMRPLAVAAQGANAVGECF